MDPNNIINITVAQPEHCMLVSWELVDGFIHRPQDQEYISSVFSQVFNYTRWKKAEKKLSYFTLLIFSCQMEGKWEGAPGRSSWISWKPSQAQKMPAAKLEKEMPLAFKSHY